MNLDIENKIVSLQATNKTLVDDHEEEINIRIDL
jgi:hypothetical protein